MLEKIRTYLRGNQRGDVFVMAAVSLAALMFCGAIVVDLGSVYAHKSEIQNAADAAALAGARAFANHEEIADNAKNAGSGQNHPHADELAEEYIEKNLGKGYTAVPDY